VLVALSVHAILEGLALGAQPAFAEATVLFVAIFAHKLMAGFALGTSLARSAIPARFRLGLLAVFAGATPVGIVLGAMPAMGLEGSLREGFEAAFLSLAAGTFVYVALLDILRDELLEPGNRFQLFGLVLLGAALMGVLSIWT
jgi:zinc transporter 1/2/3